MFYGSFSPIKVNKLPELENQYKGKEELLFLKQKNEPEGKKMLRNEKK
jgi:hypothetical protein